MRRQRRELSLLLLLLLWDTKLGRSPCTELSLPRLLGDRCCGDGESAELRLLLPLAGTATTVAAGSCVAAMRSWSLDRGDVESRSRCRFELRLRPCRVFNLLCRHCIGPAEFVVELRDPSLALLEFLGDGGQRFLGHLHLGPDERLADGDERLGDHGLQTQWDHRRHKKSARATAGEVEVCDAVAVSCDRWRQTRSRMHPLQAGCALACWS